MLEDIPNKDLIERAENLIIRLREVQSCRIYTDESGNITEIHAVAVTNRAPKLLARDVETCLKASLGLIVDYRKIGVVVIDPEKNTIAKMKAEVGMGEGRMSGIGAEPAADDDDLPLIDLEELIDAKFDSPPTPPGPPAPEITLHTEKPRAPREVARRDDRDERDERNDRDERESGGDSSLESFGKPSRIAFRGLRVNIEDSRVDIEVRLARGSLVVTGSQGDYRFGGKLPETIAGATLHAISELLDEDLHLCLARIEEVAVGGRSALCAVVNAVRERSVTSYVGCALIGADPNEYAVLAILDALNRPLGAWKLRTEINYTIR
ncbi:MAG: hypothetical protein NTW97_04220 [Candidatus Krumholzibacteria bacterium]|nr:hypothetical protein [Candidatus Krumholzibacteria bacterium]